MTFNSTKSQDVGENGLSFSEDLHWVGGGVDSPVGNQAPIWSRYYQTNGKFWLKVNTGINDWVVIREGAVSQSASPGYNFGRANANAGSYLERAGGVVTNKVGLPITFNGKLTDIFADNEDSTSYTVVIFEHSGNLANRTDLSTLVVSGNTFGNLTGLTVAVTSGKQLGAQVTAGATKNIGVTCILKG